MQLEPEEVDNEGRGPMRLGGLIGWMVLAWMIMCVLGVGVIALWDLSEGKCPNVIR